MQNQNGFDNKQLIGFILMGILMVGMMFYQDYYLSKQPQLKTLQIPEKALLQDALKVTNVKDSPPTTIQSDSSYSVPQSRLLVLENNHLKVIVNTLGGQIQSVLLKGFNSYDAQSKIHQKPLYLINEGSADFYFKIKDKNGNIFNTKALNFKTQLNTNNQLELVTQINNHSIKFQYTLDTLYGLKCTTQSDFPSTDPVEMVWNTQVFSHEKGKTWEQGKTEWYFSLNDKNDVDYATTDFNESENKIDWLASKQQFFATIIQPLGGLYQASGNVSEFSQGNGLKKFESQGLLKTPGLNQSVDFFFVPLDYPMLKSYQTNYHEIIPFGWGFFGWINKYLVLPLFNWLATFGFNFGWVILMLTIVIKMIFSPIQYKQQRQTVMMRILKPELEEINEKYKKDALKKQQETMAVYSKAGVNPLAGCIPALIQIPIFYALFNFFPNVITLRGQSFLWAEDLTAYDTFVKLPFEIPLYGAHISLFAIMYSIVLLVYTKMTSGNIQQPQQEGLPDMQKLMYIMPLFFVVFLNSYASGLSWYYFVSNAINIGIILFMNYFIIDEKKVHDMIVQNKQKPVKQSKWQQRLKNVMEQAQAQQEIQKQQKKK